MHEVAQDSLFAHFLLDYMNQEATPTLAPVPGIDLDAYKLQLIERFSNAGVRDTVARLCAKSSERIPSGCCRSYGRISLPAATSPCRLLSLPVGRGTPKGSTNRVSRSRWSID